MRYTFPLLLAVWVLWSFSGCADMINSLREESAAIDREAGTGGEEDDDTYAQKPRGSNRLSADSGEDGGVRRGFGRRLASFNSPDEGAGEITGSPPPAYRRMTRNDFVDANASENSLWDGQGQKNFLFSQNRQVETGDLITADVEKELKREIQYQLWMTLPPDQRRVKRQPASADGKKADTPASADAGKSAEEKNKDAAEEAAKTNMAAGGKEEDIVRMEVAENLGNGLVRVVGQKRVIYRGLARVVEVMALVNNKDVDDSGRVKSSSFIDMKTQVIQ